MTFKKWIYCTLFVALFGNPLLANEVQPLGAIIRPHVFDRFLNHFNQKLSTLEINQCFSTKELGDFGLEGVLHTRLAKGEWNFFRDQAIGINLKVLKANLDADFIIGCKDVVEDRISIKAQAVKSQSLSFHMFPLNNRQLKIEITPQSWVNLTKMLEFESDGNRVFENFINQQEMKAALVRILRSEVHRRLTNWANRRLRNFSFLQSVRSILSKSEMLNEGVQVQRGPVKLSSSSLEESIQRDLFFGFYPRSNGGIRIDRNQIEFYVNSQFFRKSELNSEKQKGLEQLLQTQSDSEDIYSYPEFLKRPDTTKPSIHPKSTKADISLVIPERLINIALENMYLENLLLFNTEIKADGLKGLITPVHPNLSIRAQLSANKPPKLRFRPEELSLEVHDYFLGLGTFIENRLIPELEIQADVKIKSSLQLGERAQTLNLQMDPKSFSIELKEGKRFQQVLDKDEIDLLERLARELWRKFFTQYPQLVLFMPIIDFGDIQFQILSVEPQKGFVFVHIDAVSTTEAIEK